MNNNTVSVAPCPVGAGALSCPAAGAVRVYEFDVVIWPWVLGQNNDWFRQTWSVRAADEGRARRDLVDRVLARNGYRASLFVVGVRV